MKERPILMTPENAQKCFEGVKTQTRRIVKQPNRKDGAKLLPELLQTMGVGAACPYGVVGDRLWMREAFTVANAGKPDQSVIYRGDPMFNGMDAFSWKWSPSLHMPRWACRTVVEITEIRVERVQEISEADAIAEGVEAIEKEMDQTFFSQQRRKFYKSYRLSGDGTFCEQSAKDSFITLWDSINGPGSWSANPFVWALSFRKVSA